MKEIWKQVKGYEGKYEVSSLSRVRSMNKMWKEPRVMNPMENGNGYLWHRFQVDGVKKMSTLHRLVAIHFIPNPNLYPCINHKNGDKQDNRIENLEWCTYSQNACHAFKTGLNKPQKREDNPKAKLTEIDVLRIREIREKCPYLTYKQIGGIYGVTATQICTIVHRQQWK